ncbi:HEAT repeat domain-containing protein [Portibacter lacus]|uniref:HEAT repeat domain-containing protein n=1 Tax=Portibacter lacus TaxID=1099794 RepID=A0AA37WF36_9BACT|nr:HEAT repeat domain-containing protein [Portibacter lacus]GLR17354.1 hypothetical protein GCM10007940_19690 [Portibacter lacus]
MNKENKIIDYLEGQMSFEESIKFEQELKKDPVLKEEFATYQLMYNEVDQIKLEKPSITLKSNFDHLLETEIKNSRKTKTLTFRNIRNVAAVAAILVIGILVGQNWTQRSFISKIDSHNAELVSEMKRNMNSESVSGRIEALQVSHQFKSPENEVLKTLIKSMKNDESPNVRLAAVEALDNFAKEEIVRTAFVKQLSQEKDPFVLIALINTLSEQKVEKAIDPLQHITNANDVAKFIKDEAHMGLIKIEKI